MSRRQQGPDVVQAYVAKRQAQLEHAQQLRLERKNQAPPQSSSTPPCMEPQPHMRPPPAQQPPPMPMRVTQPVQVDVTEESFTHAVREGVVSMDQARQLWFMLSGRQPVTMSTPVTRSAQNYVPPPPQQSPYQQPQQSPYQQPQQSPYQQPQQRAVVPSPKTVTPELHSESSYLRTDTRPNQRHSEWNFDTTVDAGLETAFPSRKAEPKKQPEKDRENREPSLTLLKQRQLERRASKSEWNSEGPDSRDNDDTPVYGSARGPTPQEAQPRAPVPAQQQQQQQQPPLSSQQTKPTPKVAPRAPQRPPTPPSAPPPQVMTTQEYRLSEGGVNDVDNTAAVASAQNRIRQMQELQEEAQEIANEEMLECGICGRSFRESTFDRHQKVCAKASKPRKVFDAAKMRADGIEGLKEAKKEAQSFAKVQPKRREAPTNTQKMPKWQAQHEQLQAAMKAVKVANHAQAMGLPPPPMPAVHDDRVPCPHCGRKYAEDVAERHIPKCANIQAKPKALPKKR